MVFPFFIWRRSSSLGSDAYCLNEQSRRETQGACEAGEVHHVEDLDRAIFAHRGEGRAYHDGNRVNPTDLAFFLPTALGNSPGNLQRVIYRSIIQSSLHSAVYNLCSSPRSLAPGFGSAKWQSSGSTF